MRKVLIAALAAIIALGSAAATAEPVQSRESTIVVEGTEENITELLYESVNGFSLWYPVENFLIVHENGIDVVYPADEEIENVSMTIVPVDIPMDEAAALIDEAIGSYDAEKDTISDVTEGELDSGLNIKYVEVLSEGMVNRFYLVTGEDKVFCLNAAFPVEATEGFGTRLERIVFTMELANQ